MAIYIDPPLWPAHGTEFSHLVSDTSLAELHSFAAAAGIADRAFDGDHYDVPVRRYRKLVALGAKEVDCGTLTRILIASGLRIPARQRAPRLRRALLARWAVLAPHSPGLGESLVNRWSEAHRRYHTPSHLLDVLEALDAIFLPDDDGSVRRQVRLAAWFHDAVYDGVAGEDERASAALAEEWLTGRIPAAEVAEVVRLIRLTASHNPARGDRAGELLCDADLAVLGRSVNGYGRYVAAVRQEYAHVSDTDFAVGRVDVVRRLLVMDQLYRTAPAQRLWQEAALANLADELRSLTSPVGSMTNL
ncbi:putative metal-dependent HD superfamily phosphohydrolase [Arthrobacter sp. CAN_A212]|uniref:DUF4031 domain-containing protein n=1 Tax=unclassified Arthrobacter TaxID=235627 RepID=UPI0018CA1F59|nr:DUF4031 domain-containing protein [Arthrobacter sp. CAN_C5]MBP2214886.1 putative metal-dependent HD superfamily phosphohydrolase [Arthrobacter sp. CAN_C5]